MRELTLEQTKEIYDLYINEDFPPEEVKPFASIERMHQDGGYVTYGLYEEDIFVGYAFLCKCPIKKVVLLDYLAIRREFRGKGYGHKLLAELKGSLKDCSYLMIETEADVLAKNDTERQVRERRDRFYTDNGVIRTDILASVYQADYRIWYMPVEEEVVSEKELLADYEDIYRYILSENGFQNHFFFKY